MNTDNANTTLRDAEVAMLQEHAARIAGFDFGKDAEYGSEKNVIGLRAGSRIFSRRLDSMTIFARDEECGIGRPQGTWTGAKRPIESACRKVLRGADIVRKEIARVSTLTEYGGTVDVTSSQAGSRDKPTMLRRVALAERSVSDVPVWSSQCTVELTAEGRIGSIELHWPWIAPDVAAEATTLQQCVLDAFEPKRMKGGEVESVDVGIVHSPSIGFFMDVRPVVRVVYTSTEPGFGRKAVAYLDRHGNDVDLPRSISPLQPPSSDDRQVSTYGKNDQSTT